MRAHAALALLALFGCKTANPTLSEPVVTHRLEPQQMGRPEPTEERVDEHVEEPLIEHTNRYLEKGLPNRLTIIAVTAEESGDDDFTTGLEYERLIHPNFGVGGLLDYFEGAIDQYLVAGSFIYHPVHQVGFAVNPGVQFRDGADDRLAVRTGMFYDFEITTTVTFGPVIYIDFIEGGERANMLGLSINFHF